VDTHFNLFRVGVGTIITGRLHAAMPVDNKNKVQLPQQRETSAICSNAAFSNGIKVLHEDQGSSFTCCISLTIILQSPDCNSVGADAT
jgi:hypothetical protein